MITNSNSRIASKSVYLDGMSEPGLPSDFNGVYIGRSRIYRIPFLLDLDKLINKNIAVLGMSGSGKSYFMKSFIIRSNLQRGSSVLIIDWNNEYRETVRFVGGKTLTLGLDLRINLFDLYDLKNVKNIRRISDVVTYSLNLNQEESYAVYSGILSMSLSKNQANLDRLISELKSEGDPVSNRLASKLLQLKESPMFSLKTDFPVNNLLDGVVNIDFSMLRDDSQRVEISSALFRIIIELMHGTSININGKSKEKIIVLDEAWRLIKSSEEVAVLFREGRKYGYCIAVATQMANDINNEVISNAACMFLFRLQNESDYRLLKDSGIISESDKQKIMQLPVGSCMVSMALSGDQGHIRKFFIGSTDGITTYFYDITGGKVKNRISHGLFAESTRKLQVSNEVKDKIMDFIGRNNNEIGDVSLVGFMVGLGVERAEVVYYLRLLGLKDATIVKAYENVVSMSKN